MSTIMMEIENEPKGEFDDLLLMAVRQGDANLLESHLSTVVNPNVYLNRIYNEADDQKCTLLMIACLNKHENVIHMLLHRFAPDLEVLNDIFFGDINISRQMYFNVSILWAATLINNFQIVKLLVEHGANVNHATKTRSTPLRGACYNGNIDMARYLVTNGADINIAKENNETNLMVSVCFKQLKMVAYLVDELGCDVNECDGNGRSALYDAVYCKSLELVEFLLKRGARNFPATRDQMSPLMWAAEKRCVDLVQGFFPYCSLVECIEAKELLGSAFIYFQIDNPDLDQAFEHFYRALELRIAHTIPKVLRSSTIEIFDNRQECQILSELENIRSNLDNMLTEGLLIRERLLGPTNEKYRASLFNRGGRLADNGQYRRALMLWMHELELYQEYSILLEPKLLRQIASLICEMLFQSMSIPIDALIVLLTVTNEELVHKKEFDDNLSTLLLLVTIITKSLPKTVTSVMDRHRTLYRLLCTITQHKYTTSDVGLSLLHLCLDNDTSVQDNRVGRICKYPCLKTARILLQCGADVNATDAVRNTPLHIFASNASPCDETILELLCNAGAHLDYVNALGETPVDLASNSITKQLLKNRMKLSLKCLCARLIQKNSVPFHGRIATSLVHFVEKH